MGSFQTLELIETFISYAGSIKRCVCIVYDPQRSSAGGHALKAVRLKDSFIQARTCWLADIHRRSFITQSMLRLLKLTI